MFIFIKINKRLILSINVLFPFKAKIKQFRLHFKPLLFSKLDFELNAFFSIQIQMRNLVQISHSPVQC